MIIAMIPARMGSKRVPKKNLRLLGEKPLVAYIIEAAKAANCFDEIYLNSEDEIFKTIADEYGIKFYQRRREFAADQCTNDTFALDFMMNVPCTRLVQLLPTSPFITHEDIQGFVMQARGCDTLVSVKEVQIESIYRGTPINFEKNESTLPSQHLTPVLAYACALMAWNPEIYKNTFPLGAYHGSKGNTEYFQLSGYATVDIDKEEDFLLAESILHMQKMPAVPPRYYGDKYFPGTQHEIDHTEVDVPQILLKDRVMRFDGSSENKIVGEKYEDIVTKMGVPSWSYRVINSSSNSMTLICQNPGEGNRLHLHPDWDEFWEIKEGAWIFEIEGAQHRVEKGQYVFIPRGKAHRITATGDKPAIRMAVSRADVPHVYLKEPKHFASVKTQKHLWANVLEQYRNEPPFTYSFEWGNPDEAETRSKNGTVLGNYAAIKKLLQENIAGKTVLELGSFEGKWTQHMTSAKTIICADLRPEPFEKLKQQVNHPGLHFYQTQGYELTGIQNNSVDFIFCMDTLVRSEPEIIASYFSEFARVLQLDGKMLIHLPCKEMPLSHELGFTALSKQEILHLAQERFFPESITVDDTSIEHGILLKIGL